jgi:hypothetical protein
MYFRSILAAACLIALALIAASTAAAQDQPITLDTLTIDLWPEFDQPSMLVIYSGSVADAAGPMELTFTLPPDADFHVAAYIDGMDRLIEIPEREVSGDTVTFTTPNGTFRIEFYDPALDTSSPERRYIYTYRGDYAVSTLTWSVQAPPAAENMTTEPAGARTTGLYEMAYYVASVTDISQDEPVGVLVKYTKPDSALTADVLAQQAESVPEEEASSPLIPLLIVIALAVLGIGAYVVWQTRKLTTAASTAAYRPARRGGRSAKQRSVTGAAPADQRFCTKCGTQAANATDKFCRKCGAALRGT